LRLSHLHGKNGFVTATKLGTTNKFFVAATKNFAAATKRLVDRTKHFVVKNVFLIPILTNDFVSTAKSFFPVYEYYTLFKILRGYNNPDNKYVA